MRSLKATSVNDYLARAPEVTRPILAELRRIFLAASPKIEETIKWGIPIFAYKGDLGGLSASRAHVTWSLWKARQLNDRHELIGHGIMLGGRVASLAEMPPEAALTDLIRQAVDLNERGVKVPTPRPDTPADFAAAINESADAAKQYAAFTPARQWQYVNCIAAAKRPETRAKRIQTAVGRIGEGKTMK